MTADTAQGKRSPRRVSAKRLARRQELLATAAECFADRGYGMTTVRDIADKAGMYSGSLYHYFPSKEAMLSDIVIEFQESMLRQFDAIIEGEPSPRAALDGLVRASFLNIHEHPHQVMVYQNEGEMLAHLPEFEPVNNNSGRIRARWMSVLTAGVKSGDFRGDLELDVAYRFIRSTVWSTVRWYDPDGRLQHNDLADQFLKLLDTGFLTR